MMAADDPGARVFRHTLGGKDRWPDPEPAGMRILAFQRKRSINRANPLSHILRMDALDVRSIFLERYDQAFRQHGDPILHAVAIAHDDLTWGHVEVFDAQAQTCHPP